MQKLKPITFDQDTYNHRRYELAEFDVLNTKLTLSDYDWMHYTLEAELPVKPYGNINITFEYHGACESYMKVNTFKKSFMYRFDSEIYKKNIIKYLNKHISHWDSKYAFYGEDEVVDFYNEVISDPKTVREWCREREYL